MQQTDDLALMRIKVLTAGIFSLILAMGVARFAYTPLLPQMQQQANLSLAAGGWLAAINYLGYLFGAIIASKISDMHLKDRLYRYGLLVAVVSTFLMSFDNLYIWLFSRFIAGLSSAAAMLLGTGLILNWLIRHNQRGELGIHFSGVGLGIAASALIVHFCSLILDWQQSWLVLGGIAIFLLIPAWYWLPPPDSSGVKINGEQMLDQPPSDMFVWIFLLIYFCTGVGYVVSATFIVVITNQLPGLAGKGNLIFLVIGLAAAPACIIWDLIARKIGYLNSLIYAAFFQILSIVLPLISSGLLTAILGAILFGATFIGMVSLVLTMAGLYYPSRPAKMMGKMTIAYGVAQIITPALIGQLSRYSGSYQFGLYIAAAMLFIASCLLFYLKNLEQAKFINLQRKIL